MSILLQIVCVEVKAGSDKFGNSINEDRKEKRRENATLRNTSSKITPIRVDFFLADTLRATPKIRVKPGYRRGREVKRLKDTKKDVEIH